MSEHLPRHRLDELVATGGAGASPADEQALAHLRSCAHCEARRSRIVAARAAFLAQHPAAAFVQATVSRPARQAHARQISLPRRLFVFGAGSVAAAAALLLWLRPAVDPHAIRYKGAASFAVYVKHAEQTALLRDGAALTPGTQLAFVYSLARPKHLLLLSIDDTGAISRYFPVEGVAPSTAPALLAAGARVQLPLGIELDHYRGIERLFAFFSDSALDEASVRRALAQSFAQARARGLGLPALSSIDAPAEQASVWFRKP